MKAMLLLSQVDSDVNVYDYLNDVDNQVLTSQILSDEEIAATLRPPTEEHSHCLLMIFML